MLNTFFTEHDLLTGLAVTYTFSDGHSITFANPKNSERQNEILQKRIRDAILEILDDNDISLERLGY